MMPPDPTPTVFFIPPIEYAHIHLPVRSPKRCVARDHILSIRDRLRSKSPGVIEKGIDPLHFQSADFPFSIALYRDRSQTVDDRNPFFHAIFDLKFVGRLFVAGLQDTPSSLFWRHCAQRFCATSKATFPPPTTTIFSPIFHSSSMHTHAQIFDAANDIGSIGPGNGQIARFP